MRQNRVEWTANLIGVRVFGIFCDNREGSSMSFSRSVFDLSQSEKLQPSRISGTILRRRPNLCQSMTGKKLSWKEKGGISLSQPHFRSSMAEVRSRVHIRHGR